MSAQPGDGRQFESPARREFTVSGLPRPVSHYAHAVQWNDLVFVSGLFALDHAGSVIAPGEITEQARTIHDQLELLLDACGSSMRQVVSVRYFLTDIKDRAALNTVRQVAFGDARPASTLVEVSALAVEGLVVEVEAIAGLDR